MKIITALLPSVSQVRRSRLGLMLSMIGALASCHKDEPAPAPAAPAPQEAAAPAPAPAKPETAVTTPPAVPAPAAPAAEPEKKVETPMASPSAATKGPGDEEINQRVATFRAFHPYSTSAQLLRMSQFTSPLDSMLDTITKDPALMDRVKKSAKTAGTASETSKLDLRVENFSAEVANRLLGTVLSGEASRLVDFVLNEADPANIQFVLQPGTSPK